MAVTPGSLESVVIDVASSTTAHDFKVNGLIRESADKSLTLITDDEIPVSSSVAMQSRDMIFLGQVLSCIPECGTKWTTHVQVRRSLLVI